MSELVTAILMLFSFHRGGFSFMVSFTKIGLVYSLLDVYLKLIYLNYRYFTFFLGTTTNKTMNQICKYESNKELAAMVAVQQRQRLIM